MRRNCIAPYVLWHLGKFLGLRGRAMLTHFNRNNFDGKQSRSLQGSRFF